MDATSSRDDLCGPMRYESYEWFTKDTQGHWVSGDPFEQRKSHFAGVGKVPEQQVIPRELAEQFLSVDGKYWSAWREIDKTEAVVNKNVLRMTQKFGFPLATIAMRVPYLPKVQQAFADKVEHAQSPGVIVHQLGRSANGHALSLLEIGPADGTTDAEALDRPVVLLYADEDGDEPDGCWVDQGVVQWLISDDHAAREIRRRVTFLCIPLFDPDGAAACSYAGLTDNITLPEMNAAVRPEVSAYLGFLLDWLENGHRLDIACALHNVECMEEPTISSPLLNLRQPDASRALNLAILSEFSDLSTNAHPLLTGFVDHRLMGWCAKHWGALLTAFEMNSRFPQHRLAHGQLAALGARMAHAFAAYLDSPVFTAVAPAIAKERRQQLQQMRLYWSARRNPDAPRTAYELIEKAY